MREYVSEAMEAIVDCGFGESYDHEKANMEQSYEDGFEDGYEDGTKRGFEQGKKETIMDMIKSMFKNDVSLELISKSTNKSIKEVKSILEIN